MSGWLKRLRGSSRLKSCMPTAKEVSIKIETLSMFLIGCTQLQA